MKKLNILLTMLLCISANLLAHDFEVTNASGKVIYYKITSKYPSKTVSVSHKGKSYSSHSKDYEGVINIPEVVVYDGEMYAVTSIGENAFFGCTELTSIEVPNTIERIGNSSFYECSGLTSITIPNCVTRIDSWAFSKCTGLTSIVIPNSVEFIDSWAFTRCTNLTNFKIPETCRTGSDLFLDCPNVKVTKVSSEENSSNSSLQEVVYTPATEKPTLEDALKGLKSWYIEMEPTGQRIGDGNFIDAYIFEEIKNYMSNTCPDAKAGVDYSYPSCTYAKITAKYNFNVQSEWNGSWYWHVNNAKIIFDFGTNEKYSYIVNIPNFKQLGDDFSGAKVYNALRNRVTEYVQRYNSSKVIHLQSYMTKWRESNLKEYFSTTADIIEGIYESTVSSNNKQDNKYKLAVKKMSDGNYALIYLGGVNVFDDWKEGEIKAFLTPTSVNGVFKSKWLLLNKEVSNDYYVSFTGNTMVVKGDDQETYIKLYPTMEMVARSSASSGTGFFVSNTGYIVTNNHVIEDAVNGNIKITGINGNNSKSYKAKVEVTDKQNDLAILKITDPSFTETINVPYTFKFSISNMGEDCFVLGYPLISSMGKDIKLTNGIISSKTGFDGNIAQYQISAPVQPGNSGGPLFDKSGNIIGVVQAKHTEAENAGYAIKASYIKNLVELLPTTISFPQENKLKGKTLPQQVELASKNVVLIIVNGD